MELQRCLEDRRSCRSYSTQEVPLELIYELIHAATTAPSAGNVQNWHIVIVTDPSIRKEIATICIDQQWMADASVHLVVCSVKDKIMELYPQRGALYGIQNVAAATQNILLKAQDLGLGSCWVGAFKEESIANLLKLPKHVVPEAIISIGYIKEQPSTGSTRMPVENVVSFNEFGKKALSERFIPPKPKDFIPVTESWKEPPKVSSFWKKLFH